jgi:hypothetical protein
MSREIGAPLVGVLFVLLTKVQDVAHRDRLIREWQQRKRGSVYELPRDRSYESILCETDCLDAGRASVTRDIRPSHEPCQAPVGGSGGKFSHLDHQKPPRQPAAGISVNHGRTGR